MSHWTKHYLNARGKLAPFCTEIALALTEVEQILKQVCTPIPLDIVIEAVPNTGIPQLGFYGFTPRPGVIFLTFDPENPMLAKTLGQDLQRTIAHEIHHAMRWQTVGYGKTLGEAVVSEGLAGHFVQQVFGSKPEIWESAVPRHKLRAYIDSFRAAYDGEKYHHDHWFFGVAEMPNWLGYALGWQLVGSYLNANPDSSASGLVAAPAALFADFIEGLKD